MAKKVTADTLASEIDKILEKYGDDVSENLDAITKEVGKKGVQALKTESKATFDGSGKYASNWTSEVEKNRLYTKVTIYNKTPGLPHLLEHGHALVAGGRRVGQVKGREHIAPVEQSLVSEFESEVMNRL